MSNSVLDVLKYLFEYYMEERVEVAVDQESLHVELKEAGFKEGQIVNAFEWLQGLASQRQEEGHSTSERRSMRVYTPEEEAKLNVESRGLMLFLEQVGVLDPDNRELVIDRVMALETDDIDLDQLKWIILMILLNQTGYEDSFFWKEDLIVDQLEGVRH